jgi:hypothetical protein
MIDFSCCCCCFIFLTLYYNGFVIARDYLSIHSVVAGGFSLLQPNMHAYAFGHKFWHYHVSLVNLFGYTKMEIKITYVSHVLLRTYCDMLKLICSISLLQTYSHLSHLSNLSNCLGSCSVYRFFILVNHGADLASYPMINKKSG